MMTTHQVWVNAVSITTFSYADDLSLTDDNRLLVGSRTSTPRIYDLNLVQLGQVGTAQQMLITNMPDSLFGGGFE